ncbi:MAG: PIN domain-containing protein [Chloroflexi bacterium]|nr:PIN domain-containing protein [Chloroflexota bacterium]
MPLTNPRKLLVFVDADVLFAGSASANANSSSQVVLSMAEITLIEAITSEQVIAECERNLIQKIPSALPAFRLLVDRCLHIVPDPVPGDLAAYQGLADSKDLPVLVATLQAECPWLVTFNLRHFQPGHHDVQTLRPGDFVLQVRDTLTRLIP